MSIVRSQETELTDRNCIADALQEKYNLKATLLEKPEKIRGHYNEKSTELCDIVVKKEDSGRGCDIGFSKGADGKYKLVTDTYVNRDMTDMNKWVGELKIPYARSQARKIAKQQGLVFRGEKVLSNGKVRLQFAKV